MNGNKVCTLTIDRVDINYQGRWDVGIKADSMYRENKRKKRQAASLTERPSVTTDELDGSPQVIPLDPTDPAEVTHQSSLIVHPFDLWKQWARCSGLHSVKESLQRGPISRWVKGVWSSISPEWLHKSRDRSCVWKLVRRPCSD